MPPPCAVEAHVPCYLLSDVSNQREPSPDKPGASRTTSSALLVAANVNPPRTSRGHPKQVRQLSLKREHQLLLKPIRARCKSAKWYEEAGKLSAVAQLTLNEKQTL